MFSFILFHLSSDGRGAEGISEVMSSKTGVKTEHLLDKIHLLQGLNHSFSNLDFSDTVFAPNLNRKRLNVLKNCLRDELAYRIRAEIRAAEKKYCYDFQEIIKTLKGAISCIGVCFSGKHDECKKTFPCLLIKNKAFICISIFAFYISWPYPFVET